MPTDDIFLLSAIFSRYRQEQRTIEYLDLGYEELAEVHNNLALLTSIIETEIELGVPGEVVLAS